MKKFKKGDKFKYTDLSNVVFAQCFNGKTFTAKRVTRDGRVYSEENPFPFAWFFLNKIEKVMPIEIKLTTIDKIKKNDPQRRKRMVLRQLKKV